MVAIVHENESAVINILFKVFPFLFGELYQFMTGQITKRAFKNIVTGQGNDVFHRIHLEGGILYQGVEQVGRHTLVHVPIAGLIL
jgi:hypothetical protein